MMIPRKRESAFLFALIALNLPSIALSTNVVIFLADNLGYDDVSFFRNLDLHLQHHDDDRPTSSAARRRRESKRPLDHQTQNIDGLANSTTSRVFTHWNSAAHLCSASRASLLTGQLPVRLGVYPGVFGRDAVHGLPVGTPTLASILQENGYATGIVGKWHLGQRTKFLPTNFGFDDWLGIPYHMSGGSVDGHECNYDENRTIWLPLYHNTTIVEQPVRLPGLAQAYAQHATRFLEQSVTEEQRPFFLYVPFSHVHQLCAPRDMDEQSTCQWSSSGPSSTFGSAVEEMDWIAGQVLNTLRKLSVLDDTVIWFTSDNGPWVAEQSCSGSKGPFLGTWLAEHAPSNCTACPHDYTPEYDDSKNNDRDDDGRGQPSHMCRMGEHRLQGVPCGLDTGLGSLWEANLRMPSIFSWPRGTNDQNNSNGTTRIIHDSVSTLDILPTTLSLLNITVPAGLKLDGLDISPTLLPTTTTMATTKPIITPHSTIIDDILHYIDIDNNNNNNSIANRSSSFRPRILFFWRDGYSNGPLPAPYGRVDVAAVKVGPFKYWLWTKSAHTNDDPAMYHNVTTSPLVFDVMQDPAEAHPLGTTSHHPMVDPIVVQWVHQLVEEHRTDVGWTYPWALARDPQYTPCVNPETQCRTHDAAAAADDDNNVDNLAVDT